MDCFASLAMTALAAISLRYSTFTIRCSPYCRFCPLGTAAAAGGRGAAGLAGGGAAPGSAAGAASEVPARVIDVVMRLLGEACPELAQGASGSTSANLTVYGAEEGHEYIMYFFAGGGYGGHATGDGLSNACATVSMARVPPIELLEKKLHAAEYGHHWRFPLAVEAHDAQTQYHVPEYPKQKRALLPFPETGNHVLHRQVIRAVAPSVIILVAVRMDDIEQAYYYREHRCTVYKKCSARDA